MGDPPSSRRIIPPYTTVRILGSTSIIDVTCLTSSGKVLWKQIESNIPIFSDDGERVLLVPYTEGGQPNISIRENTGHILWQASSKVFISMWPFIFSVDGRYFSTNKGIFDDHGRGVFAWPHSYVPLAASQSLVIVSGNRQTSSGLREAGALAFTVQGRRAWRIARKGYECVGAEFSPDHTLVHIVFEDSKMWIVMSVGHDGLILSEARLPHWDAVITEDSPMFHWSPDGSRLAIECHRDSSRAAIIVVSAAGTVLGWIPLKKTDHHWTYFGQSHQLCIGDDGRVATYDL